VVTSSSVALLADTIHNAADALTDGRTSLAAVIGAAGRSPTDRTVGLVITAVILAVLRGTARDIYHRLMDTVDPALFRAAQHAFTSRRNASQSFFEARRNVLRIRWTMQVCTIVCGHMFPTTSGSPLRLLAAAPRGSCRGPAGRDVQDCVAGVLDLRHQVQEQLGARVGLAGLVTRGTQIRVYPAKADVGVGRKGRF